MLKMLPETEATITRLLEMIEKDPRTKQFQREAWAQFVEGIEDPYNTSEFIFIPEGMAGVLENRAVTQLLIATANFVTNIFRFMYFGYAPIGETEEEALSRIQLRQDLLNKIMQDDGVIAVLYDVALSADKNGVLNQMSESFNNDTKLAAEFFKTVFNLWQALVLPDLEYPQNTMLSNQQRAFLSDQQTRMRKDVLVESEAEKQFPMIAVSEIREQLFFLHWLLREGGRLPIPKMLEAQLLYVEVIEAAKSITGK